jgi:hypothetical protein
LLWNKAGLAVYGRHWQQLAAAQQEHIQAQVNAIVAQAGWHEETAGQQVSYVKPLAPDMAGMASRLGHCLQDYDGRPIPARTVVTQAQLGAYGRAFYTDEMAPELATAVAQVLQSNGYCPQPEDGDYRPAPIVVAAAAQEQLIESLSALPTTNSELGPALMLRDVLAVVKAAAAVETIGEWQAEQLVRHGMVSQVLRRLGFQAELTWCQPYQFRPKLAGHDAQRIILKAVRVQHDPDKTFSLAQGLAVYTPAVTIDDVDDTLVYLEMFGPKQSVKANWAALVGGGKVHWLGRKRVQLEGMKSHIKIQSTLPCGWANHILIHKQASLREMNPEQPFYLLDDGTRPIPPLFYPMLNKCLALPLLESWSEYLWENGRERNLITLLDNGEGQGYAAWRVLPAAEEWQQIVTDGLKSLRIDF